MTRQSIGIGSVANDRTGDPLRTAFQKTNSNFIELYERVGNVEASSDRHWVDQVSGHTYDVYQWSSGSTVQILSSPTQSYTATTYDARTDSNYIYFVWDELLINDTWQGFEISLDNGVTWYAVERHGYSTETNVYFSVPYQREGQYTFTYVQGMTVLLRYNTGSIPTVWFDLSDAPVSANSVVAVILDVIAAPTVIIPGHTPSEASMLNFGMTFANTLYDDNTGAGRVQTISSSFLGDAYAKDLTVYDIRNSLESADSGRIYCVFQGGNTGSITFYWNAKLFTRS